MNEVKEALEAIASRLREFGSFAQNDYIYMPVEIEEDKEFDLGAFGYASADVRVEADDYQFDADEILGRFPMDSQSFLELAEQLDALAQKDTEVKEPDLNEILVRMEAEGNGGAPLARALRAVVEAFNTAGKSAVPASPYPDKPAPWPGASRIDIDYTAADFALRYQPPPGFDWSKSGKQNDPVPYTAAVQIRAEVAGKPNTMVMDALGRVKYSLTDDRDTYTTGARWIVWHVDRDGIPMGRGFSSETSPRAIARDGETVEGQENWSDGNRTKALRRLSEIRAEYEQTTSTPEPTPTPEVSYDLLTVSVSTVEEKVKTSELRLGDDVTGFSFGRVTAVSFDGQRYDMTMNRNGDVNTNSSTVDDEWFVLPIDGVDRLRQPTALSLSQGRPQQRVDYDPLTVPLKSTSKTVRSSDLRLGEDICGFGRVMDIKDGMILMRGNSGGNKTITYEPSRSWAVKPLDVPDRDAVPTAASFYEQPVAAS